MDKELIVTEVTIRISCLSENKLTADLYLLLHWKFMGNYKLPDEVQAMLLEDDAALEYLEKEGFIKITGHRTFELRQKGIDLFKSDTLEIKWLEFLGKFPLKVPARNGGTRPLKIGNPDSVRNKKIKDKYISIIKSDPSKHRTIINVLEAEVKMRRDSGNLQYMHAMEVWLNQADYDKYEYLLDEQINNNYENEDYM
jgi:hypothetical protein